MIFAIDEALKTFKERVSELEKEKAMLEINVKQEHSSASALAKPARKETASLRKDLSATRAELTTAKEHVMSTGPSAILGFGRVATRARTESRSKPEVE